jgi:hypothetical protein
MQYAECCKHVSSYTMVYMKYVTKKILHFCLEFICSLEDLSLLLVIKATWIFKH